ncbi:host nuclease inhibitor protein [Pseudomonas mosselii]|uniref:Host nuclease inhibitor protein n=1 Tax=Pseudomonas mosselii TaxID=78327 RepID=A0ABX9AYM2_9PSED|nr:host nuclease inhibitor protein [Pseudomonas mosselii]QZP26191.1 host nuclease inhibitor protein [Pseudomonas mosselii]
MVEQSTISIDSIMEQVQVFASAWSLVDGPFDQGNALENAEEAKTDLREMLEAFCSNTDLKRVAEMLVTWHQRKMGNIEQVLSSPADTEIRLGETNPVVLTGEKLQGFRIGLIMARSWFENLPLKVTDNSPVEEE